MAEDALVMYKKEQIFYNPLLNPDDITIEAYDDNLNPADFDAPSPNELMTGLLGEASQPNSPTGKVIRDIDNLFYNGDLPQPDSQIFAAYEQILSAENQDKTVLQIITESEDNTTAIGQLKTTYNELISDPLFQMLPNTTLKEADIIVIIDDLNDVSLAFKRFKELYFASTETSIVRKIASEIERTILVGDSSATDTASESSATSRRRLSMAAEEEPISFEKLISALANLPFLGQLRSEFGNLLAAKPGDLANVLGSLTIVNEIKNSMNVTQIIDSAVVKRNEELFDAEMDKETQHLIIDFYSLIAAKPLFG